MDMSGIAILIYFGFSVKLVLSTVALSVLRDSRRPPVKGTRKQEHKGSQRTEPIRHTVTEGLPVMNKSPQRRAGKRTIFSRKKALKPAPDAIDAAAEAQETPDTIPSKRNNPWSRMKKLRRSAYLSRKNEDEAVEPGEMTKHVPSNDIFPLGGHAATADWEDESMSRSVFPDAYREQSAVSEAKSGWKPSYETPVLNTGEGDRNEAAATTAKSDKSGMDIEHNAEVNPPSRESTEQDTDSDETDDELPQAQNSSLGDLADLFAVSASEFAEKNNLAEQVSDVDVNDLLKEGLGLLDNVRNIGD